MPNPQNLFSRRALLTLGAAGITSALSIAHSALSMTQDTTLGLKLDKGQIQAGRDLLARFASVDIHAHPGRFFLKNAKNPTPLMKMFGDTFENKVIKDMHKGQVTAALFCGVADMSLIEMTKEGGLVVNRNFVKGEALSDYRGQMNVLKNIVKNHKMKPGFRTDDILKAKITRGASCVFSVEGGDFIEDRLERISLAHRDGVRSVTLVHYRVNGFGDIQTAAPVHNGLTPLGRKAVKAMNRIGILVDAAHASLATTRGIVDATQKPIMLSHSNLPFADLNNPRLISIEHAKLVASTGGLIGSIPWGIGQSTVSDWIDSIMRLIDAVGPGHVGIGTDMDANFRPVFTDYNQWHLIPAALLARGLAKEEVAAIIGGNFLRVFRAAAG